jgi:protein-tyrosine phosphatase
MTADRSRVLFVCTANRCRSPMAEVIARAALARAGADVEVGSAGTFADPGLPATDDAEYTVRKLGLDLRDHASRQVTDDLVDTADLIVCMERNHLMDVCRDRPDAFARTFTLKDLARRAAATHRHPAEPLGHWLTRLHEDRVVHDVIGWTGRDDVDDPTGRSLRRHRRTAAEIAELVDTVVEQLNPPIAV